MKVLRVLLHCLLLFLIGPALTEARAQMVSAFARERSGTLPRGRFFVSMVSVNGSIDSLYGQDGVKKPLSANLSRDISFQRITSEEPTRRRQLAGLFRSNGVSLSESAGELSGTINGQVSGKIPVLGYGITDRLGVYLTLPIIQFKVSSSYRFKQSEASQKLLAHLKETDQRSTALEIETALNTSLENKLSKAGYAWSPNREQTYLGDAQILFLQTLPDSDDGTFKQAFQPSLVLPTAAHSDMQDLYGLEAGKGRLGLGLKYSLEQKISYPLQFNFSAQSTYLFANHQGRRLPISSDDTLKETYDSNTEVSGGMQAQSQAQVRYAFPKWFGASLGLLWQREFGEHYEGSVGTPSAYESASLQTDRELLSTYAAIDLNSIPSFLEGHFWFPATAELGIGLPLRGRNSVSEPIVQLQGSLFF